MNFKLTDWISTVKTGRLPVYRLADELTGWVLGHRTDEEKPERRPPAASPTVASAEREKMRRKMPKKYRSLKLMQAKAAGAEAATSGDDLNVKQQAAAARWVARLYPLNPLKTEGILRTFQEMTKFLQNSPKLKTNTTIG